MVARREFIGELGGRVDRGVDLAAQSDLGVGDCLDHLLKGGRADHHQVDIAAVAQFPARCGAEDEGDGDVVCQRFQRRVDDVREPSGLGEQALQLRKDEARAVGLEVDLAAVDRAGHDAGGRQQFQFTLRRADGRADLPGELAQVERRVRVPKEPREDAPTGQAEEQSGGIRTLD